MHVADTIKNEIAQEKIPVTKKKYYRSGYTLFFSFYKKYLPSVLIALFFLLLTSLGQTLPAVLTGMALDELDQNGFGNNFLLICAGIILVSLMFLIAGFVSFYIFFKISAAFERDIRQEFFDVIQDHSLTFHDEANSSKLLSMGMTEISQMRTGVNPSQRILITSLFSITIALFFLNQISIVYSGITLVGIIIYIYFAYRVSKKISPVRNKLAQEVGRITESSQEIFRGIDVVRGLNQEKREKEKFAQRSKDYAMLMRTEGRIQAFYIPNLIILLLTAIIFAIGIVDLWKNTISIGTMVKALALLFALQMTTRVMPSALLLIQAGLVNSRRIWNVMHWIDPQPDEALDNSGIEDKINWKGTIEFKDINFSYGNGDRNGKLAIKDLNLSIPGGSRVAVIGGPGGGKSSILKLLLRLYDPQSGKITIDGYKYKEIPASIIRTHVSRVEQEIFLFSGSIRENIAFSKPKATDEEIIRVAKAAQAHEFISQFPEKYETVIGERGVTLSGGQKQRIGIARALLVNPDILLLDDSVSAVDSRTEYYLRKALENLMKDRTSFTVTQRIVTLVNSDFIILLDKGEVIGFGNHLELLKSSHEYQQIFKLLPKSEQISDSFDGGDQ